MKKIFSRLFLKYLAIFIGILFLTNIMATILMITGLLSGSDVINPIQRLRQIQPDAFEMIKSFIIRSQTLAFSIGVFFIFVMTLSITRPIRKLIDASKKVADGDFSVSVPEKGNDEITELTQNFNKMVTELSDNEYLHKDFVSNVSHEFKTPITSLKGYAKLLKEPDLSVEKRNECADIIIAESERLSNLSTNLLRLSELENSTIELSSEMVSLDEQIRDVLLLLQNEWEKRDIDLELELDEIEYRGDRSLLYQVWINLIENAIRYSNDGGKIKITLKRNDKTRITIMDDGIGMTDEDCKNVFRRFYKADKSRNSSGTGLGLSIVQRIVELHGGEISVSSDVGKGSCFIVSL